MFQRRRVDMILDLITRKFPPKLTPAAAATAATANGAASAAEVKDEKPSGSTADVKSEKGSEAAAASSSSGVKREAGQMARGGPDPKKSKLG